MVKAHIPHPTKPGAAICGRRPLTDRLGRSAPPPVFIHKNQLVDEATCKSCWRADDARQVRDYRRECKESGIDPDTLEKIK